MTGFPKDYSDYVIPSSLLINRGLVYNIPKKGKIKGVKIKNILVEITPNTEDIYQKFEKQFQ